MKKALMLKHFKSVHGLHCEIAKAEAAERSHVKAAEAAAAAEMLKRLAPSPFEKCALGALRSVH